MNPLISRRDVSKISGSGETAVRALHHANMDVMPGELVLVEGPSGSGKTTLVSILGLLLKPTSGEVWVGDKNATALPERALPAIRARAFGFVFQGFNLFPALTALDNVALAIRVKEPSNGDPEGEAMRLLDSVGLADRPTHLPGNLSGGRKQRVALARALGGSPQLIIGDQPTAALDSKTGPGRLDLPSSRPR